MTLSGATTLSQSGYGSDYNKGVLRTPPNLRIPSIITGAWPSDCLESYTGHSLRKYYLSTEMQLVYSSVQADWDIGGSKFQRR